VLSIHSSCCAHKPTLCCILHTLTTFYISRRCCHHHLHTTSRYTTISLHSCSTTSFSFVKLWAAIFDDFH
jgi:hypothetical protein